jgi:DNA processing protein
MDENLFKIALTLIPKIGPRLARRLVAYSGSLEAVFSEKAKTLEKIPGIGETKASQINRAVLLSQAEKELEYIRKEGISMHFYLDENYPVRLRECEDAPVVMFAKGDIDFNAAKIISIVGTRHASEIGKQNTFELVEQLAANYPNIIIVSGLAYGIDITAHKAALKFGLDTIAVLGHGMEQIYPPLHTQYAHKILEQGALVTEFIGSKKPDPGNFVSRNRIIAGLADATVVVESAEKGGSLITADLANSYNRDVFAFPGRVSDMYSKGCHQLIKTNKAALVECAADIETIMGWGKDKNKPEGIQKSLFMQLTVEEEAIMKLLTEHSEVPIDEISIHLKVPVSRVSASLLNLEFNGLVRNLPGKVYTRA